MESSPAPLRDCDAGDEPAVAPETHAAAHPGRVAGAHDRLRQECICGSVGRFTA